MFSLISEYTWKSSKEIHIEFPFEKKRISYSKIIKADSFKALCEELADWKRNSITSGHWDWSFSSFNRKKVCRRRKVRFSYPWDFVLIPQRYSKLSFECFHRHLLVLYERLILFSTSFAVRENISARKFRIEFEITVETWLQQMIESWSNNNKKHQFSTEFFVLALTAIPIVLFRNVDINKNAFFSSGISW